MGIDKLNIFADAGLMVGMMIAFFFIELIIGFFFNSKIHKIAEKKNNLAAIYGGVASFLLTIHGGLIALFLATSGDVGTGIQVLFVFCNACMVMAGNVCATILVPHVDKRINMIYLKRKEIKKFKLTLKQNNRKQVKEFKTKLKEEKQCDIKKIK